MGYIFKPQGKGKQITISRIFFPPLCLFFVCSSILFSQVENVPVNHPIYSFFSQLEVRGILPEYNDVVLPLSRKQIAGYLQILSGHPLELSPIEKKIVEKYNREFEFELNHSTDHSFSLFGSDSTSTGNFYSDEKHLYTYIDSEVAGFIDGWLTVDSRLTTSAKLHSFFAEFGGSARGTIDNTVGFSLLGTNAVYGGDLNVLLQDERLRTNYKIYDKLDKNFDFAEGYLRFAGNILSAEIGRERILWGRSAGERLILSNNPAEFDMVRFDAKYKSLQYNFLHGWLIGKDSTYLPLPTGDRERIIADKYIAVHRLGFTFSKALDVGVNEMVIYSNRSVDAAYVNPLTFIESTQRSRKERDNTFLVFDAKSSIANNIQLRGSILFDDVNFKTWGARSWDNRWAFQTGILFTNTDLVPSTFSLEYSRIEPYVFSHGRSREDNYTTDGWLIGIPMQPNSESYFFSVKSFISAWWSFSAKLNYERHGANTDSANGNYRNVGGDVLSPHRLTDAVKVKFLDGTLENITMFEISSTYELFRQLYMDAEYTLTGGTKREHIIRFTLRMNI